MGRKVLHASKVVQRPGYTRTTTMCNRMTTGNDGMNIAEGAEAITCKFCLKVLARIEFNRIGAENARKANLEAGYCE